MNRYEDFAYIYWEVEPKVIFMVKFKVMVMVMDRGRVMVPVMEGVMERVAMIPIFYTGLLRTRSGSWAGGWAWSGPGPLSWAGSNSWSLSWIGYI